MDFQKLLSHPAKKYFLLPLLASVLNFAFKFFVQDFLNLPLFFDTVFVVTLLFFAGLFPALISMAFHSVFQTIQTFLQTGQSRFVYLYFFSGAAILIATHFFSRQIKNSSDEVSAFTLLFLSALVAAFFSAITSGILNALIIRFFSEAYPTTSVYMIYFGHTNKTLALILGRIPLAALDRVITTFLGYGIFLLMEKFF